MITIFNEPTQFHAAGAQNYWTFVSDFRFAPRFNIRANIVDCNDNALLNSLLLPTNPQNYSVFNAASVLPDFIDYSPSPYISTPVLSAQAREYRVELSESFQGLYIQGTASAGIIQNFDVVNNETVFTIATPSSIRDIGFVGGDVITPIGDIFILNYGTASTTSLINSIEISQSPTQSQGVSASIGITTAIRGFILPQNISVFSVGATNSSQCKWAILGNPDYLTWNAGADYSEYTMTSPISQFLTNFPYQTIFPDEVATLSFINGSASVAEIVDNLGGTYSKAIPQGVRIDIPSGTRNLQINPAAQSYTIVLKDSTGATVSLPHQYNISNNLNRRGCSLGDLNPLISNVRVLWLNDLGGWDYFTFKWVESKSRVVEPETFYKNLTWLSNKGSRGVSRYRVDDWQEWTLSSDEESDVVSNSISSLYTSKEVYVIFKRPPVGVWILRDGAWNDDLFWVDLDFWKDFYVDELVPIEVLTLNHRVNSGWDNNPITLQFRLSRQTKN